MEEKSVGQGASAWGLIACRAPYGIGGSHLDAFGWDVIAGLMCNR